MRRIIITILIIALLLCLTTVTALADDASKPSSATEAQTALATAMTGVVAALFLAVCILLAIRGGAAADSGRMWPVLLLALVLAVCLRLITAAVYTGYATDMACFKYWSQAAYEGGLSNFYTSDMFADYPPGYMYVLYVLGFIRSAFAIDPGSMLFTVIVKLPSILAEAGLALFAYKVAGRHGKTFGLLVASLILFNPAMFFNSSVWGQIDAVFTLFAVLSLYYLKKENGILGAVFFTVALLIKPHAIMLAPVVGMYYIYSLFKKDAFGKAAWHIFGGLAAAAAIIAIAAVPFTGDQQPLWIIDKYAGTIGQYNYASLNAFNLYAMLGKNWTPSGETFLLLNYQTWGMIFIVLICASIVFLQWRSRDTRPLFDIGALLLLAVFMLAHAMHERYIVPVGVLLIFAYIDSRDRTTLFFAAAFALTALVNEAVTLYAPSVVTPAVPTVAVSAVNMVLFVAYAIITYRRVATRKVLIKSPALHG